MTTATSQDKEKKATKTQPKERQSRDPSYFQTPVAPAVPNFFCSLLFSWGYLGEETQPWPFDQDFFEPRWAAGTQIGQIALTIPTYTKITASFSTHLVQPTRIHPTMQGTCKVFETWHRPDASPLYRTELI